MPPTPQDDRSSLERARERLYAQGADTPSAGDRTPLTASGAGSIPHVWSADPLRNAPRPGKRHVRLAGLFFAAAFTFFLVSLAIAAYFFYFGGNSVSTDKITIALQGPTAIAGGDTVPLSVVITNRNPTAISAAALEITFPEGTRSADDVLAPYPRYTEDIGTIESGASVTRSVKAVIFGSADSTITIPIALSYKTAGSNAVFVKKTSYDLAVSSTPLSVSVDTLSEAVAGKPFTLNLTVRSNATVPLENVVLAGTFPFGFTTTSSSVPLTGSSFLLGTLAPGATKTVTLTGALTGQNNEERAFHFTVGTARSANDSGVAVSYMTQDATVTLAAPFIRTTLAMNGAPLSGASVTPGTQQSVTVRYENTLPTNVTNAGVTVTISGSAVDYNSIRSTTGFYQSSSHSVVFSGDSDPSLSSLAPGASGIGTFTFLTLPASRVGVSPQITFTTSVSGTRVGQSNVPENVSASASETVKMATAIAFSATALHAGGPITNGGPIPPKVDQATSYTIQWSARTSGSAVAGGTVSATLPNYITYTGATGGSGAFSFDAGSHTVTWNPGDLPANATVQGYFQISITPSSSQRGSSPALTGVASFSGHDRFAGVDVSAMADPVTTETRTEAGYTPTNASVQ